VRLEQSPLRGNAENRIRRAITRVSAGPLYDLEKETLAEHRAIELEILSGAVAIVQDIVRPQPVDHLGGQSEPCAQVIVIIGRNLQRRKISIGQRPRRLENIVRAERDVLNAWTEISGDEVPSKGTVIFRAIQGQPQTATAILDDLAAHEPARIDDVDRRALAHVENRRIEQHPGKHLVVVHRLGDVVDLDKARVGRGGYVLAELPVPDAAKVRLAVQEIEHAAADAAD